MSEKHRGLGRGAEALGLHELIAGMNSSVNIKAERTPLNPSRTGLVYVSMTRLVPGRYQPRTVFDDDQLLELAASIQSHGVIQPIVVRAGDDQRYEIIAGERRWRAAKLANLDQVPVLISSFSDEGAAAVSLIENIQREDLNVVDEAQALHRLSEQFNLTHEALSKWVGKSRSSISNTLRILEADEVVRGALVDQKLSMGHARALLSLPLVEQVKAAHKIIQSDLSVRSTERLVKRIHQSKSALKVEAEAQPKQPLLDQLRARLKRMIFFKTYRSGAGYLKIHFNDSSDLEAILRRLLNS